MLIDSRNQVRSPLERERRSTLLKFGAAALLVSGMLTLYSLYPVFAEPRTIQATPSAGYYDAAVEIELENVLPIIYTLDGSVPTEENHIAYEEPIALETGTVITIQARTLAPSGKLGDVQTFFYAVGTDTTLPILAITSDPEGLWGEEDGILTNYGEKGTEWERLTLITYLDYGYSDGTAPSFSVWAGLRVHGDYSRQFEKRSLRIYMRREYGQSALVYPLFDETTVDTFESLVIHAGGEDWQSVPDREWSILCNQLAADLAFDLDLAATHSQPVLLYINGEPWGIYYLRERPDAQWLASEYGITNSDMIDAAEHTEDRNVVNGSIEDWDALIDYLNEADLSDPEAYAYTASQVDLESLTNCYWLQIYANNADWPQHNNLTYRDLDGSDNRWKFAVWDTDHGWDIDCVKDFDMVAWLYAEHPHTVDRQDTVLIRALLENDDFREAFIARGCDLLNTYFEADGVISRIDELAAEIAPDIEIEEERWESTTEWSDHIQRMKDFCVTRPDVVREDIQQQFGLGAMWTFTMTGLDESAGQVLVNGIVLASSDFEGTYFEGMEVTVEAIAADGYTFVGWEGYESQAATITLTEPIALQPLFEESQTD